VVGEVAEADSNRSLCVGEVGRFQEWAQSFENFLPAILFQPILLLLHPLRFIPSGEPLSGCRQVITQMIEVDRILCLRSELHLHLLDNPGGRIAHPMKLGLVSRTRLPGADRQSRVPVEVRSLAVLDGSFRRGHVRPLRQDQIERGVSQRNGREGGLGFELPSKIIVIGRNGRKLESARDLEMTATA
jgi:hypothetical protein